MRGAQRTSITLRLVVAATLVGGLFGWMLDRALVATPAWRHLGVHAWAEYSRHADLDTGYIVYPVCAILLWALIFAAAVSRYLDRSAPRGTGLPIYLAALFSIGAISATIIAAPIIQSVGSLGNDPGALQSAFDRFTLWGVYVRGGFFALSFVCTVWALAVTAARARQPTNQHRGLAAAHRAEGNHARGSRPHSRSCSDRDRSGTGPRRVSSTTRRGGS